VIVYTSGLYYTGHDRIDIALWTPDPAGQVLGPRATESLGAYGNRLFALHSPRKRVFQGLLGLDTVTICCSVCPACLDPDACHRTTLARSLVRLGAEQGGERPREVQAHHHCSVRGCQRDDDTGHTFCAEHWHQIPVDMQRELARVAPRARQHTGTGYRPPEWIALLDAATRAVQQLADMLDPPPRPATDARGRISVPVPEHIRRRSHDGRPPPAAANKPRQRAKRGGWQFQEGRR
jgi:hypothetical protein